METGLMVRDEALLPTTFDGLMKQAQVLVKSGLLPQEVRTPEAAVVIMLKGRELDIPPMTALSSIYVVKGKPSISAQLMGALILRAGHAYHVDTLTNDKCVITFTRKGGQPYTHEFTMQDASAAQLAGSETWKKYTKAMLFSRCMSAGARIAMPDVIAGMYTPEEMTDAVTVDAETGEVTPAAQVIDVKPVTVTVTTPPAQTQDNGHAETKRADWTQNHAEREAFRVWRERLTLTDTECKSLAAKYLGHAEPLAYFREYPGTRLELQNAIEAQMAREQAMGEPEPEALQM